VCSEDRDPRCRLDVSAGLVFLYDLLGSARTLAALDKVITLDHRYPSAGEPAAQAPRHGCASGDVSG
jgi:hypothetical protein